MGGNKLVNYSIVFIAVVFLAIVLKEFQSVLRPLIIAVITILVFLPVIKFAKRKNISPNLAVLGTLVLCFAVLALLGAFLLKDVLNINDSLPGIEEEITSDTKDALGFTSNLQIGGKVLDLSSFIEPKEAGKAFGNIIKKGIGVVQTVFLESLFVLIFIMFLIPSYSTTNELIRKKYGVAKSKKFVSILENISKDVIFYFKIKIVMSLGTAIGVAIVLFLFGMPFIFISSVLVFSLNFIPTLGSLLAVALLVGVYVVVKGVSIGLLWFFLATFAVQILFGSILEPKVAGQKLNISPILILLSLSFWGWIWGIIGALLAVPLTTIVKIILKNSTKK